MVPANSSSRRSGGARAAASRSLLRSASAVCSNASPCNCRNHVCALSQYLQRFRAETYDAIISCWALVSAPSVKCMREAAWMAARKSGRRLMVLRISATTPIGLCALAVAYNSARGPSASAGWTILIRAINYLTEQRWKGVVRYFAPLAPTAPLDRIGEARLAGDLMRSAQHLL